MQPADDSPGRTFGIAQIGLIFTYLASATTAWNGWKIGIRPGDIFLILAVLVFLLSDLGRSLPKLPAWVWQFAAIVVLVTAAHELIPTDPRYIATREVVTPFGVLTGNVEIEPNLLVGLKFVVPIVGLPLMYAFALRHDRRAIFRGAYSFAIGTAISAFIGVTDRFHITRLSATITGLPAVGGRAPGLTSHPNFLAMTCVLSLPIVLWQLRSDVFRSRVVATVLLLVLMAGLYASASRAGAAVGPGTALLCIAIMPRYRPVLPTAALLAACAASLAFVLDPKLGHSLLQAVRLGGNTGSAAGSDEARAIIRNQAFHDFAHSPIDGIGMQVAEEAHDAYLQALAAGGLLLLAGYAIFVICGLLKALRYIKVDGIAYPLFAAAFGGALFVIVQSALIDRVAYVQLALIAALPALRPADQATAVPELAHSR